jgi:hypothetical protein
MILLKRWTQDDVLPEEAEGACYGLSLSFCFFAARKYQINSTRKSTSPRGGGGTTLSSALRSRDPRKAQLIQDVDRQRQERLRKSFEREWVAQMDGLAAVVVWEFRERTSLNAYASGISDIAFHQDRQTDTYHTLFSFHQGSGSHSPDGEDNEEGYDEAIRIRREQHSFRVRSLRSLGRAARYPFQSIENVIVKYRSSPFYRLPFSVAMVSLKGEVGPPGDKKVVRHAMCMVHIGDALVVYEPSVGFMIFYTENDLTLWYQLKLKSHKDFTEFHFRAYSAMNLTLGKRSRSPDHDRPIKKIRN